MSTSSIASDDAQNSPHIERDCFRMDKVDCKKPPSPKVNLLEVYGTCMSTKRNATEMRSGDKEDQLTNVSNCRTAGNESINKRRKTGHGGAQKVDMKCPSECFEIIDQSLINLNFPYRLRRILDNQAYNSTIRWHSNGLMFKVFNIDDFEQNVIPQYFFTKCKYWSFTRRLCRWGFLRVSSGPEFGSYHHPLFKREEPDLMAGIRCLTSSDEQRLRATTAATMRSSSIKVDGITLSKERSDKCRMPYGVESKANTTHESISASANPRFVHQTTFRMNDAHVPRGSHFLTSSCVQSTISLQPQVSQESQSNIISSSIDRELLTVRLAIEAERQKIRMARIHEAIQNQVHREYVQREEILEMLQNVSSHNQSHFNSNSNSRTAMISNHDLPRLLNTGRLSAENFLLHNNIHPAVSLPTPRSSQLGITISPYDLIPRTSHQQDIIRAAQIMSRRRLHSQFQSLNGLTSDNRSSSNSRTQEDNILRILRGGVNPTTETLTNVSFHDDRRDLMPRTTVRLPFETGDTQLSSVDQDRTRPS